MLILLLVGLALLVGTMALIDLRARRRGHRYTGVDGKYARDQRRLNDSDVRLRSNDQGHGQFPGAGF